MKKAACYLRVSTLKQDEKNQLPDVLAFCKKNDLEPVLFYEKVSATKERAEYSKMLDRVAAREFDAVVCWRMDRLTRNMRELHALATQLDGLKVQLYSVTQPLMSSSPTGSASDDLMARAVRSIFLTVIGMGAEMELITLKERTRAGLERAKAAGRVGGRPKASPTLLSIALDGVRHGESVATASAGSGISERTLRRAMKQAGMANPERYRNREA